MQNIQHQFFRKMFQASTGEFKCIMEIEFKWTHLKLWVTFECIHILSHCKNLRMNYVLSFLIQNKFFLGILGFASHQTFESTTHDEICQAFLKRSKKVMRNRELAMEQMQMKKQNKV